MLTLCKTAKSDVKIENAARNFGGHLFSYFDGLRYQIEYLFVCPRYVLGFAPL